MGIYRNNCGKEDMPTQTTMPAIEPKKFYPRRQLADICRSLVH